MVRGYHVEPGWHELMQRILPLIRGRVKEISATMRMRDVKEALIFGSFQTWDAWWFLVKENFPTGASSALSCQYQPFQLDLTAHHLNYTYWVSHVREHFQRFLPLTFLGTPFQWQNTRGWPCIKEPTQKQTNSGSSQYDITSASMLQIWYCCCPMAMDLPVRAPGLNGVGPVCSILSIFQPPLNNPLILQLLYNVGTVTRAHRASSHLVSPRFHIGCYNGCLFK
jgi:hypothetical protein